MERRTPRKLPPAPRLPRSFDRAGPPAGDLPEAETYASFQLASADYTPMSGRRITFEQARLSSVILTGTHLDRPTWSDVQFERCDLSNARWDTATLIRAELNDCRLVGFSLGGEAYLESVRLVGCNCHLASFRYARLKSIAFEDCLLNEADFQGCDLGSVSFIGCDLRSVELSQSKLRGVDLRGCQIDGIRAGPAELQGAIIDPVQAAIVAQAMGITVEWPEN